MATRKKTTRKSTPRKQSKKSKRFELIGSKLFIALIALGVLLMMYWKEVDYIFNVPSPALQLKQNIIDKQQRYIDELHNELYKCKGYETKEEKGVKAKSTSTSNTAR